MSLNLIDLTRLLRNPNSIQKESTRDLEELIVEFPYFQAARALQLHGLKKENSYKYNSALKKTAAFTNDRSILFDFITRETFQLENYISENQDSDIKEFSPDLEEAEKVVQRDTKNRKTEEAIIEPGSPIIFRSNDKMSFNEWLKLSNFKEIDRSSTLKSEKIAKKIQDHKKEKFALIEKFIASNAKISPIIESGEEDFTDHSSVENTDLMTETLAHVYLEQKKYEKAITAFQILSLKYPEKSSFFALQIEAVKQLQQNN